MTPSPCAQRPPSPWTDVNVIYLSIYLHRHAPPHSRPRCGRPSSTRPRRPWPQPPATSSPPHLSCFSHRHSPGLAAASGYLVAAISPNMDVANAALPSCESACRDGQPQGRSRGRSSRGRSSRGSSSCRSRGWSSSSRGSSSHLLAALYHGYPSADAATLLLFAGSLIRCSHLPSLRRMPAF